MTILITLFQIACVAALLWSLYNFYVVLIGRPTTKVHTTGMRPSAAKSGAHSTTKVPFPPSLDAGELAHQQRGAAKTAKLPIAASERTPVVSAAQVDDDEAMRTMFAQMGQPVDVPVPDAESSILPSTEEAGSKASRKASRLAELGFHHSINPDSQAATTILAAPAPGAAAPGAPRSNTAELNAILERIDQFLAEDPKDSAAKSATAGEESASEATPTEDAARVMQAKTEMLPVTAVVHSSIHSSRPLEPKAASEDSASVKKTEADAKTDVAKVDVAKATPLWARADAVDEDVTKHDESTDKPGEQQRLF